jgi:hypothetical protein
MSKIEIDLTDLLEEANAELQKAYTGAIARVIKAVSGAAASAAGATQDTAGALAAAAGLTDQSAFSEAARKNDVSVPEGMESLNYSILEDIAARSKTNAKLYDITASSLGIGMMALTNQNGLNMNMASDHRDQNHTKQALATTFPFVVSGDAAEESADDTDRA